MYFPANDGLAVIIN